MPSDSWLDPDYDFVTMRHIDLDYHYLEVPEFDEWLKDFELTDEQMEDDSLIDELYKEYKFEPEQR